MTRKVLQNTTITKLGTPIAAINAIHSGINAEAAKPDDAGGLYPTGYKKCSNPL